MTPQAGAPFRDRLPLAGARGLSRGALDRLGRSCRFLWAAWSGLAALCLLAALVIFLVWLHAGYHTFARQKTAGLQLLLTVVTLLVLLLERQIINLDISRRGYLRSFPRLVCRLARQ